MNRETRTDFETVHAHIAEITPKLLHDPSGWLRYPWVGVSWGPPYDRVEFCWDAFHQCLRLMREGKVSYFRDLTANLLAYQAPDGWTPYAVHETHGFTHSEKATCMPFLAQAVLLYLADSGDNTWAEGIFARLENYLEFWARERGVPGDLYAWWLESGYDNDVSHTFFRPRSVAAVSASTLLWMEHRAASLIARRLGKSEAAARHDAKAGRIKQAINDRLWSEEYGCYANIELRTGRHLLGLGLGDLPGERGRFSFFSWNYMMVLYPGLAPEDRARRHIEQYLLDPGHFRSPHGIRSLSARSEYYNNAIWGNPARYSDETNMTASNWQGPVWFPVNYFVFHSLINYGYLKEAEELADTTLRVLAEGIRRDGGFFENYHAETGRGLYAPLFGSWNMLADIMHDELEQKTSPLLRLLA